MLPVVSASAFTIPASSRDARLSTHSRSRRRLATVSELTSNSSMQLHPSHQADDMGATLTLSSSLRVVTSTTGVPQ